MKTKLLTTLIVIVSFAAAVELNAQYRPTGDDGITASPRLRQQLNDRAASKRVASTSAKAQTLKPESRGSCCCKASCRVATR